MATNNKAVGDTSESLEVARVIQRYKTLRTAMWVVFLLISAWASARVIKEYVAFPVNLPPLPAWVTPVEIPDPKEGDDWRIIAAKERAARLEANRKLKLVTEFYESLRELYAKNPAEDEKKEVKP